MRTLSVQVCHPHSIVSSSSLSFWGHCAACIRTPWTVATSQPGTADIPAFSQTICQHSLRLHCMLLSPGQARFMIHSATLLELKWYWLLTIRDSWDALPDQICCSDVTVGLSNPFVHLFLIDAEHRSAATAVISCIEEFKIPTDCSQNVTFWDSLPPNLKPKIALWEQNRLWVLDWAQMPYFDRWPVFLHSGFKLQQIPGHYRSNIKNSKCIVLGGILSLLGL